jgi:iron complex outermembrane receptor protein
VTAAGRILPWPRPGALLLAGAVAVGAGAGARAQADAPGAGNDVQTLVVVGPGPQRRAFDAPLAVGVVDAEALRSAGPMVNLSEALTRVPGLVVGLRHNYAQDLQISSRGFGARASFGVRGIRLFSDGIPAAGPDGQGQVSHFDLAGADRVEVLRGPFSALHGASSGGAIVLASRAPAERAARLDLDAGSDGLQQARLTLETPLADGWSLRASGSRFEIDGFRPQSAARRSLGNLRLGHDGERNRFVLTANTLDQPAADPLGLSRAQFDADPDSTAAPATQFDTRKLTRQEQLGASWQHRLAPEPGAALRELHLAAYTGQRSVTQWQSIAPATQANPRHPGGVIDFDRRYAGLDARAIWRWGGRTLVAGLAHDRQREARRGFENFAGSGATPQLGTTGRLRRDEDNLARGTDAFVQFEAPLAATLAVSGGLRHGRLALRSRDRFDANGDDSGTLAFRHTLPVLALRWQPTPAWTLYASAGRGHEAPTLGELAYRPDGQPGFNLALRPQRSRQVELGAKWRDAERGLRAELALFEAATHDEIGVQTNAGGRSSFRNVGRTSRRGLELSLAARLAPDWRLQLAATTLDARYRDAFLACAGVPCTAPSVPVAPGRRIAGTVPRSGFVELAWAAAPGLELALEARGQGRQPVNDANTDFAGGHGLLAARLAWQRTFGPGRLELLVRVDNPADRRVAGSVIVNEANQRFFEPAAGRTLLSSLRWRQAF